MVENTTNRPAAGDWATIALGVAIGLIGVVLVAGGIWLVAVGGSAYYALAGVGLVVTGYLLARRRAAGAWVYALVFAATVVWAFWEAGLNGWALVPRVIAPLVLLVLVILATPRLMPFRHGWRTSVSAAVVAVLVAAVAGFGIAYAPEKALEPLAMAAPSAASMTDPSPMKTGADWPAYGGTYSARRYSPLEQITPQNVAQLQRAWTFHTGDLPNERTKNTYGAETTPLKIGDTLYLCTPKNIMIALDARSGEERWRYDPQVSDENIPYTAACRGVTYYVVPSAGDAVCATRIIEGTLDARLIAVDAKTGDPCQDFGEAGAVDTSVGIGSNPPGMLSITSAPTIVHGVVVVGHQVLDGQMRDAPSGVIQGYDAVTGELRWAWDMVRPDRSGLPPEGETYTRGTPNMWTTASGDEELGLVYLPLGVSAVDYWSGSRSEPEKEFATSLVALDVESGKPVWHFQTVHNDVWDYDLGSQATLIDFPAGQATVPALLLPSKRGDIFVLDRRTGRPLTGVEERPVPQGGVEPEQRTATQPFSLYHTLQKPDLTETDMWGMSPIDQMICRIQFRTANYQGIFTPPTTAPWVEYSGYNGGSDWGGIAVDPRRGVIVANYNDMPNHNRLVPREEADRLGWAPRDQARGEIGGAEGAGDPQAGAPYAINVNAGWRLPFTGLLCKQPPYGGIRAIDIATGETLWDKPLGQARTNGPFGIPSMLPVTIGTPNNGGAVVTASGLIFIAAATDNLIRAIDIATGKVLWTDVLPAGGQATPMTYEIDGRQYLVIMAGGHHFMETPVGDALVSYALPKQ
ncbi:membrane-bound PQQ-dependent dehydrogenase, glucose/quinate/shikimate family [Ochrobactrum soli]|nr:membrane-bound PQQ-dependent dehydrogenase, glucose/quinate/shikimate family [[Ochrobactrum] soli]